MNSKSRLPKNEGKPRNLPIRIDNELFTRLSAVAKREDRTPTSVIRVAIMKYLEAYEKKHGKE